MVVWIRDVVLMKLEKKSFPPQNSSRAGGRQRAEVRWFRLCENLRGRRMVELVTTALPSPHLGNGTHCTAPASASAAEEGSPAVLVPTPSARFLDHKILK